MQKIKFYLVVLLFNATITYAGLPDPFSFGLSVDRGDHKAVERWLNEGLPPDYMADHVGTGLMLAAWNGDIEMMALFVSRGANVQGVNIHGEQAIQLAAWNGHIAAVRWLLEHGATLNRGGKNWEALHYAVFNGHTELAKELIERGAEVNARSPNGATPLILAAREGHEAAAKLLLESGADRTLKTEWNDNALTMAMRYDHYRLGKMISIPEEFSIAAKAPKQSFGEVQRSAPAPAKIDALLKQIREANAEGRDTGELRKNLQSAIIEYHGPPKPLATIAPKLIKPTLQGKALVITAKRQNPDAGERVELVSEAPATDGDTEKNVPGIRIKPAQIASPSAKFNANSSRVADLMRQIRVAEAQGKGQTPATQQLRQQLEEAMRPQQ